MKRRVIRPWPAMPDHRVPFVPAITVEGAGRLLFLSGTGALPPEHKHPHVPEEWILPDDPAVQARRTLDKIRRVLEAAGGRFEHIVKITRYMKDIAEQDAVNEVIHEYFGANLPCSTTIQVSAFVVPTMKIEIDAWAVIPDKPAAKPARKVATKPARAPGARRTALPARKRAKPRARR